MQLIDFLELKLYFFINQLFTKNLKFEYYLCGTLCYSVNSIPGSSFCAQKLEALHVEKIIIKCFSIQNGYYCEIMTYHSLKL